MYTGALENHPYLVDAIAAQRPLWGNHGAVLQAVRSPVQLATCLRDAGLPGPRVAFPDSATATEHDVERWLIKPVASAGGARIAFWNGDPAASERCYLQEFIDGEPCAAIYVADGEHVAFLGATLQLVGLVAFNARPFAYCGSIGPLPLSSMSRNAFIGLGNLLTATFHLRGVFGIDCVLRDGVPWPVEVNPRYTASVEVLELAAGRGVPGALATAAAHVERTSSPVVGKAILFASLDFAFPAEGPWLDTLEQRIDPWRVPAFADIPQPGSRIEKGHPILTMFATDDTIAGCQQQLELLAAKGYRELAQRLHVG